MTNKSTNTIQITQTLLVKCLKYGSHISIQLSKTNIILKNFTL